MAKLNRAQKLVLKAVRDATESPPDAAPSADDATEPSPHASRRERRPVRATDIFNMLSDEVSRNTVYVALNALAELDLVSRTEVPTNARRGSKTAGAYALTPSGLSA